MISMTHSLFNAGLARLPRAEIYISAFAVAKSILFIFQSPVIMIRQTVTSLVNDSQSYYRVRKFVFYLSLIVLGLYALFVFTELSGWVLKNIMGLNGDILKAAVVMLKVFTIFLMSISLREFMRGLAIKFNLNELITLGTVSRIIYVTTMVIFINKFSMLQPAVVAGLLLAGAGFFEGLTVFLGTKISIKNIAHKLNIHKKSRKKVVPQKITGTIIYNYYFPLLLTAFIRQLATPIINTGLGNTINPEIALSVFAVGLGLGNIAISPVIFYHQLPIYFLETNFKINKKAVIKFTLYLGLFLTAIVAILAFSGLGYYILINWIGAGEEISRLALDVLKIMTFLPLIMISREYFWGLFMEKHLTKYVSRGKTINLITLTLTIFIVTFLKPDNPAITGITAKVAAEGAELIYLYYINKRVLDNEGNLCISS